MSAKNQESSRKFVIDKDQVVVVRGGKQIAGPKRRPKPKKAS